MKPNLRLVDGNCPYTQQQIPPAATMDLRQGVLIERIAAIVSQALKMFPDDEPRFCRMAAAAAYQEMRAIEFDRPPTPSEVRRFEQRQRADKSRRFARLKAADHNHYLEAFRPGHQGYELSTCQRCGAGISLHLDTGELFVSVAMTVECTGKAQ